MARPRQRQSGAIFSVSKLADMLEVDRAVLSKRLTDSGAPSERGAKNARLFTVRAAIAAAADLLGLGNTNIEASADARRRKLEADAAASELTLAERRGELIPKAEVVTGLQQAIIYMRSSMLAIPTKAAPALFILETPGQVKEVLKEHVHAALDELSHTTFIAVGPDGKDEMPTRKKGRRISKIT